MIDPAQLRAARALLEWSQQELAKRSGVNANTIKTFEKSRSNPTRTTLIAWRKAFSKAGVEFIDGDESKGPGVRVREPQKQ